MDPSFNRGVRLWLWCWGAGKRAGSRTSSLSSKDWELPCSGSGTGRTRRNPKSIRQDVPNARMRRNVDVVLLRRVLDRVVKKNADSPKPAMTRPVADARWEERLATLWHTITIYWCSFTYYFIGKRFDRWIQRSAETSKTSRPRQKTTKNQYVKAKNWQSTCAGR